MINLRNAQWQLKFYSTKTDVNGKKVDMYLLLNDPKVPEDVVSLGIPHGRHDIADFIVRCLKAGTNTLQQLPKGASFAPDEAKPTIFKGVPGMEDQP